MTRRLEPD